MKERVEIFSKAVREFRNNALLFAAIFGFLFFIATLAPKPTPEVQLYGNIAQWGIVIVVSISLFFAAGAESFFKALRKIAASYKEEK